MKVTLDASAVPPNIAGAGRYIAELARRLPEAGVEETLLTRRGDDRWKALAPRAHLAPLVPQSRPLRLVSEAFYLGASTVATTSDVWHSPHYTMPHRRKRPTVVTIHDMTFFTHPEWHEASKVRFFQHSIRYAAQHADALICVSETTRHELLNTMPVSAPLFVAPHGVDHERFTPTSMRDEEFLTRAQLPSDQQFIFFVGTHEPRKGIDVLLRAFDGIRRDHPDVELWLAGQTGWGDVNVTERPGVRTLGFVDDDVLAALMRRAQVVTYPSRGEGFGLPVLEALASGARVVTSRGTVMEEVAGEAALYANVGDIDGLGAAVSQALGESEDVQRAARALGIARAATFTWDRSIETHVAAYSSVLS